MTTDNDKSQAYYAVLHALLQKARQIGENAPGSAEAFAAYQILDTALQEAEVWGISKADLDLKGFNPDKLLKAPKAA
ncbi:hypothetical protein AZSI13_32330 [Azospira sp. I13]|uniref:hypothetical protein n=1 Tax=Azospira sp. I13 TaxID=1765050 RepID=UPI000D4EAB59|nr:hypothetical protein [Azospira sp. I13]GBG03906.1 hypothetical protein AZSI13_32330 [Azospira sp. I13]